MKVRVAAVVGGLLLPAVAGAQVAPAAQPAPAPPQEKIRRAGPPFGGYVGGREGAAEAYKRRPDLGAWWKNSEVVQELGLTQQQVAQIEQAFFDHRLKLIDLKAAVEREEMRLQPLIEADQVNEAQVGTQIDKVLAARAGLEKANVMMMLAMRKVLTVDQWKKLEGIRHERETKFRWWIEGGGKEGAQFKWRLDPHAQPAPWPPDQFEFVPDQP